MTSSVYVAGVGMIPFVKPGANAPYPVMGAEATGLALADAGVGYDMIQQAYVGYVYGDFDLRPARALPGRHERHSDHQRQQQLLDRLDRAVHGAAGDRIRRARLRAGARLRADEARRTRRRLHRPAQRIRRIRRGRRQAGRCPRRAAGAALFRRRRPQSHEEIRNAAVVVCQGPRQGEPARQEQSAGAIPQGSHRRRRHERSGDLARRDDPPDGLPADLRRRGGRAGLGEVRQQAWPEQERPDRRAGDDDRHGLDLRRRRHDEGGRLRHDAERGQQGVRGRRRRA